MRAFADLYTALDETTRTNEKLAALTDYFHHASAADAAWVVYFLSGRKPKQVVPTRRLVGWATELAGIPDWLFSESYDAVGDLAETITLLLPNNPATDDLPLHEWIARLLPLRGADEEAQRAVVLDAWTTLDRPQRFVWNKLITGAFRVGVSQRLITRALANVSGVDDKIIAHRLMGNWEPTPAFYENLIAEEHEGADIGRPYPFFLAYPVDDRPDDLGAIEEWQAEWKWDGIRAQMIQREGEVFLWSRGEELITENFPELAEAAALLPAGTALDGEILPWGEGGVMPFAQLQRRISRKKLTPKLMAEIPISFLIYDLLELDGEDVREQPLAWRRAALETLLSGVHSERLKLSPLVEAASWAELEALWRDARERNVEGMMLKRRSSPYRVGRQRGDWWKWKVEPYTVDAVLIYAQRGSGKRASLYTDYTFGVWDGGKLVPFTKAYSGLTDAEIRQVDNFIRRNTQEKFGPVRTVKPQLVFELAFEGIQRSTRHKSGVAVRFPRIARWRHDKPIEEADTLETIQALLPPEEGRDV